MESLKKGKEIADYQVEDALYKRAIGYEYEEETRQLTESGAFTTTKIVTKHVSPDTGAIALWLKNRKRDSWQKHNSIDEEFKKEQIKLAKAQTKSIENMLDEESSDTENITIVDSWGGASE
ncbi:hypothetical protein [Carnobacterium maltaromaticum]|nr:hypothetical protein [Carnobacterium maltaromaticum]KRN61631.1 hypothetical protein IV70_GL000381 [Carnobacterium maltaromaticum DSM 20342]